MMEAIIFDLDGTLWDSREIVAQSWNEVLSKHNLTDYHVTIDDMTRTMGMNFEELGAVLFPTLDPTMRAELMKECFRVENEHIAKSGGTLYSHVPEIVEQLAQTYKLCIVSNCQDGYIEAFYTYHKLDKWFIDYENPGRTGLSKGENIKLVMKRNQLQSALYVGDTAGDQQAAQEAGLPFIYARYGFGNATSFDGVIDHFSELPKLIKQMSS